MLNKMLSAGYLILIVLNALSLSACDGFLAQSWGSAGQTSNLSVSATPELQQIDGAIQQKGLHWTAGLNAVSELSSAQRQTRVMPVANAGTMTILDKASNPNGLKSAIHAAMPVRTAQAPATFDWRNVNGQSYVSPIKDQGSCSVCWAFSSTAGLESQILMHKEPFESLSEQVLISCAVPSGVDPCTTGVGGAGGVTPFLQSTGLPPTSDYPYTQSAGSCSAAAPGWQNNTQRIVSYANVTATTDALEQAIANYGPVVTTMNVMNDFYSYNGGVYEYATGPATGSHSILIVGYDHTNQYFIVKNSWGQNWGENGFFRIAYSQMTGPVNFAESNIAYNVPAVAIGEIPTGSLAVGTNIPITWRYTGNVGTAVTIELLQGGIPSQTIATSVPISQGSYTWTIPASAANSYGGTGFQIQVSSISDPSISSTSSGFFSVVNSTSNSNPGNPHASAAQIQFVLNLYLGLLGRNVSQTDAGVQYWLNYLTTQPLPSCSQSIVAFISGSNGEFAGHIAPLTYAQFLSAIYEGLLGQNPPPSDPGFQYWMTNPMSELNTMQSFMVQTGFTTYCTQSGFAGGAGNYPLNSLTP